MFDFGFSEILVILVLALIVLGPEKLPSVVRKVGRWVGRARAMARQFQDQLEEEIDLDGSRARTVSSPLASDPPAYAEPTQAEADTATHAEADTATHAEADTATQAEADTATHAEADAATHAEADAATHAEANSRQSGTEAAVEEAARPAPETNERRA